MFTNEEITDAADRGLPKMNGKQVMGHSKIQKLGEEAVFEYVLEDGTSIMQSTSGKPVKKWPGDEPYKNKGSAGKK